MIGGVSDPAALRELGDDIASLARETPGVAGVYARPGLGQLTRLVREGIDVVRGSGSDGRVSVVGITVGATSTVVEVDVAVLAGHAAPAVARAVASLATSLVAEAGLPRAAVDVRVVAFN
jgi:hypothetical protein